MKKLFSIGAACLLFASCVSSGNRATDEIIATSQATLFTVQDVAGTYHLTSVDGIEVPVPLSSGTFTPTSGTLILGTDSTVLHVLSFTWRGRPMRSENESGTFGLAAPDTIFLIDELDTLIGRLSEGGILTYQVDEIYVYTKQ